MLTRIVRALAGVPFGRFFSAADDHRIREALETLPNGTPTETLEVAEYEYVLRVGRAMATSVGTALWGVFLTVLDGGHRELRMGLLDARHAVIANPLTDRPFRVFTVEEMDDALTRAVHISPLVPFVLAPDSQTEVTSSGPFGFLRARWGGAVLTYSAVVEYFVRNRPANSTACRGVLGYEPCCDGFRIEQVFIDDRDSPICAPSGRPRGRRAVFWDLDSELRELLGDNRYIIFA